MGCAGEREKIEDKMMLMKLERMEIQMEKEKELKKLSDIEGHEIKGPHIPDYIDPKFAREKQIYDDEDEEIGYKKTNDSRKKDKSEKSDKKKDNKKDKKDKKDKKEKVKKEKKKEKKDKKQKKDKKSKKDDDKKKKKKQKKKKGIIYVFFYKQ